MYKYIYILYFIYKQNNIALYLQTSRKKKLLSFHKCHGKAQLIIIERLISA